MAKVTSGLVASLFADEITASLGDNSPEDQAYLILDRHFTQHVYGAGGTTDVAVRDVSLTLHIKGDRNTIPGKLRKLADDLEQAARDFEQIHPPDDTEDDTEDDTDVDTLPTKNDVDALAELDEVAAWYAEQDRRDADPYSRVTSLGNSREWDDERGEDEKGRVISEGYVDRQTGRLVIEY